MTKITTTAQTASGGILRPAEAARFLGVSRGTLYRWQMENPDFPRLLHLGARSSGWRKADLEAWINTRAEESNGGAA